MDVKYDNNKYLAGESIYESINSMLTSLNDSVNTAIKKARQLEDCNAKVLYDGFLADNLDYLSKSIENVKEKLAVSKRILDQSKSIIEDYNNGSIDSTSIGLLLSMLIDSYDKIINPDGSVNPKNLISYSMIYKDKYTPQGITVIGDKIFISAYKKNANARLYIIDIDGKSDSIYLDLNNKSHSGGITYDSENHVLLIASENGNVDAYDYDNLINLKNSDSAVSAKLNSNVSINYTTLKDGSKKTNYPASTLYYDNNAKKLFIARFAEDGKLVYGDISYDKANKKYTYYNQETVNADNGIQGIATYHKDGKDYFIESRSYGKNKTILTVYDTSSGIKNMKLVGSKTLDSGYGEGISVSNTGVATMVYEKKANDNSTANIDINKIIEANNNKNPNIKYISAKYNKGDPKENGEGYINI